MNFNFTRQLVVSILILFTSVTMAQTIPQVFHGIWEQNKVNCKQSLEINLTGDTGIIINSTNINFGTIMGCKIRKVGKFDKKNVFSAEYACTTDEKVAEDYWKIFVQTNGPDKLKLKFEDTNSNSYTRCN